MLFAQLSCRVSTQTPLSLATRANSCRLVGLLVERGATVNAQVYELTETETTAADCRQTDTPLTRPFCAPVHLASSRGRPFLDTLTQLLQSSIVDLDVVDSQGPAVQIISDKMAKFCACFLSLWHHLSCIL